MKLLCSIVFSLFFISALTAQTDSSKVEFQGKYLFPEGSVVAMVEVYFADGSLQMSSEVGVSVLTPLEEKDYYMLVAYNGTVKFLRDTTSKKVNGIIIDAMGYHLEGKKEAAQTTASLKKASSIPFFLQEITKVDGFLITRNKVLDCAGLRF